MQTVDCLLMGRKTYDWAKHEVPDGVHADKQCFVFTRTARPAEGNTVFYTGDPAALAKTLKAAAGKNISVDGGAETVQFFLR